MLMPPKRYTITAALPYANGPLHIGHLAGAYLPADIFSRFLRLMGKDLVFICGSDEHGAAITIRAKKEGLTPQEIIDKYHSQFVDVFKKMGMSFDIYHRTSDELHHQTAQEFFRNLHQNNALIQKESEQYFDLKEGQFLADRYIMGTCPKCGYTDAYGDQCEQCGSTLSPDELINPRSILSGSTPVKKKTTHWYLPLDKHADWLKIWIETGFVGKKQYHDPETWKNHVLGQCRSWIENGLQERAMTRDLDWGVDVPADIPGHEGKKLYVWLDAPIGYISATKAWAKNNKKNWKDYWQDSNTGIIHFIGKDNIVFHCIIFPAILKAHGDFNLPINVPANQFLNLEGQKLSTSRSWAVWVHEYLEDFPERQDLLRYVLIKNMPEQKDSEFTWRGFQDAVNNELVANLANFCNRVFVLTHKFFHGKVPKVDIDTEIIGSDGPMLPSFHDSELMELFDKLYELSNCLWEFDFRGGLQWLMQISTWGNQLLQANEPWKNHQENPEATKVVVNLCVQILTALSVAMKPFMPFASEKLRAQLNLPPIKDFRDLVEIQNKLSGGKNIIKPGHMIGEPFHLFTKVTDEEIQRQVEKLKSNIQNSQSHGSKSDIKHSKQFKPMINIDDFNKCDIRIAKVLKAEKVENADKLLKLEVKIGDEIRTIVSGIALHYSPEEMIGKEVCVLANLQPRIIRNIESRGMILMAENTEGKLGLVSPPPGWESGSAVK